MGWFSRPNFSIGDIVKAKNTNKRCGYKRGDVIRIVGRSAFFKNDLIGENLTEPYAYGNHHVYMAEFFRGKKIKKDMEGAE